MRILDLYGRMVAAGNWKDYAIDFGKDAAVFSCFRRAAERHDEEGRQHSHDGSSRYGHVAFFEVIREVRPAFGGACQELTNGSGTLVRLVPIE